MSVEDKDNLYILEEEKDEDESPHNFASYRLNEEDDEKEVEEVKQNSSMLILFKIMFNPIEGWKSLRRSKAGVEGLQSGCFYPLLAVLALSKFADYFYSVSVTLAQIITQSIIAFVSFFFGYFSVLMVLGWFLPKDLAEIVERKFGKEYIMIAMSTLVIFAILTDLLPMLWPILIFLPIWTLYIMFKGIKFFRVEQNRELRLFILAGTAVIAMPLLIDWVLNLIMPY